MCVLSQLEITSFESKNYNHDFSIQDPHHQGFNLAQRNYYVLKTDTRKFDGNDPVTWIFEMEQYFYLHHVESLQRVNITSMFSEQEQHVWYQWFCERKKYFVISWSIFTDESIEHCEDIENNTFFSFLINI